MPSLRLVSKTSFDRSRASIISPRRSCLRRLRITFVCYLFNVAGKLWIPREHVVEGVFVKCVEITVVHSADAGRAGVG